MVKTFDILNTPLSGTNLIEASAGTGKTYTITALYLRFVLEHDVPVEKILVVTFTEAATQELKSRIRNVIRNALNAFNAKDAITDCFISDIISKWTREGKTREQAIDRLKNALRSFDQTSIFTIHGFCMRMLQENAFESGSLFDTEFVAHQDDIKKEIVDDFWRKHLYPASSFFITYVLNQNYSPDSLLSFAGKSLLRDDLKVIPVMDAFKGRADVSPNISNDETLYMDQVKKLAETWQGKRDDIRKILLENTGLKRNIYKEASIEKWLSEMENFISSKGLNYSLFESLEKLTSSKLSGSVKKNCKPPDHKFFDFCNDLIKIKDRLFHAYEQAMFYLQSRLLSELKSELEKRKAKANVRFFDDLLTRMHASLTGGNGDGFAEHISQKYSAALIDEFQDTDPLQYDIFKKIFNRKGASLFLIGDPKQAIYGFRGADIFAYMNAVYDVGAFYTLNENWRSEEGLIRSVNTIFSNAPNPFIYDAIPFHPVRAARDKTHEPIEIKDEILQPFQLWHVQTDRPGKAITKEFAQKKILSALAYEISRLLNLSSKNRAKLGSRRLEAGDMAILVRKNSEAARVQQVLSQTGIPSVIYTTADLFESHEAREMEIVLTGISRPGHERAIRAALSTDMMGLSGEDIDSLLTDDAKWEEYLIKFKFYHDIWKTSGFIRMFRQFLENESVLGRLMAFQDGERRCTNMLHLVETLHAASVEKQGNMDHLLKWMARQMDNEFPCPEERQLRLESDENAVTIVTMHKCKGLEYPIVFCPFTWSGSQIRESDPVVFHDEKQHLQFTLDMGSDALDENRKTAEKELLAENLRLLYVALTRAKNRAYMVWGRIKGADTSAPAYVFHPFTPDDKEHVVDQLKQHVNALNDKNFIADLDGIAEKSRGVVEVKNIPDQKPELVMSEDKREKQLFCRNFTGIIEKDRRVSSFSSLVYQRPHGEDVPDYDGVAITGTEDETAGAIEPEGIFAFLKGARPGTLLHDIFEHIDFTSEPDKKKEVVKEKLKAHGFDLKWQDTVYDMIDQVLSVPLDPDQKELTLSAVSLSDRITEMEFYFPLNKISPEKLKSIFNSNKLNINGRFPEKIEALEFSPVKGFMKGFMDLVFRFNNRFYIIDWKSNHLGNRVEDYHQDRLCHAMETDYYILQYLIYTVALNQYLQKRVPNYSYKDHFGGVFYVFLRGVDVKKGPDFGIFRDRPDIRLIEELTEGLIKNVDG